jgi:hypothetical protein
MGVCSCVLLCVYIYVRVFVCADYSYTRFLQTSPQEILIVIHIKWTSRPQLTTIWSPKILYSYKTATGILAAWAVAQCCWKERYSFSMSLTFPRNCSKVCPICLPILVSEKLKGFHSLNDGATHPKFNYLWRHLVYNSVIIYKHLLFQ